MFTVEVGVNGVLFKKCVVLFLKKQAPDVLLSENAVIRQGQQRDESVYCFCEMAKILKIGIKMIELIVIIITTRKVTILFLKIKQNKCMKNK